MSQVKNLRAMFENKGETSPPDRGRSPGVSTSMSNPAGTNGTGSPRPLSKVRTNFVAIEKDGRMGLRRDHSGESSLSRRRLSIETDAESTFTFPDRPAMASLDDLTKPMRKLFVSEPIPESPRQTLDASQPFQGAGAVSDKPSTDLDKQLGEQPAAALTPADPTAKTSSGDAEAKKTTPASSNGGCKGDKNQASASAAQPRATVTAPKKSAATSTNAAKPTAKPTTKAPAATKPSTEAPKRADAKSTAKVSEKPGPKRETPTAKATTAAAKSKPMSSTTANRPQPLKTAGHADTGFVKPKPKSPTKPVNLPSSLMAPTASSVSKGGAPRQSLSRQSGSLQNPSSPVHSSTRASLSTTLASAQHVKRQGSVIGRPRPSVGPPPSKTSQPEAGAGKRQSHVDEGFLARMMRPTQSSSSKTADKNPSTPPKKMAPRPSTSATDHSLRQETSARKPAGPKNAAVKKSRVPSSQELEVARTPENISHETVDTKTTESPASSVQGPSEVRTTVVPPNPKPSPELEQADVIAPATAQPETCEEVATIAHEADSAQTPVEPLAPVEDAAPETARVESAEESIEEAVPLVQKTDLVQTPAKPDITGPHLDPTPTDEPAPEADHTEVAGGEKELSHEDIGHSHAPAEELALELDTPEPAKNTESDVGEVVEEPLAEFADGASESVPAAAVEDGKDEPVLVHDAATDAEAMHGAEGSGHGPLSGSGQQVKAAEDELAAQ
ncbi:hypothetical protein TOPH_04176 [Tolypocladium ophioglossoides CBS 100239]|uniref:Uncharacterized protein n=1 Tax=Tolypocladium ophioglossoides (strain CBS 100239) TaxID=1163406 RepID=A0A0L0NB17_TOLOC|nr:hypothetical protein TOPH_04176 [Tolypocladium ophioglossoides CBS 100239]